MENNVRHTADILREYVRTQLAARLQVQAGRIKELLLNGLEEETNFFCVQETDELIHFEQATGRYKDDGIFRVKGFCEGVIREAGTIRHCTTGVITEVEQHVRRHSFVSIKEFETENKTYIPLANGILDITTMELIPYSKEFRFIKTLGVNYKPDATCPNFEKVLTDICIDENGQPDLKMRKSIIQMFAYCMWRAYPMQYMFFLIGGGANAKGTILGALQEFLGSDNVSNRSVTALSENRFAGADLFRKHANISNELTVDEVKNVDLLKSLVSGTDYITAERKFEQPFNFMSYAKIIIATNAPPKTQDASDGFYRRLNLIRFQKQFLGKDDRKELKELVKQPDELSGILNLALVELKEWLNEDKLKPEADFANSMPIDEVRELYERMSDTVASFRYDAIELTFEEEDVVSKDMIFKTYKQYCKSKKISPLTENKFWKEWRNQTVGEVQEKRVGHNKVRSYCGLNIKEEYLDNSVNSGGISNGSHTLRFKAQENIVLIEKCMDIPPLKRVRFIKSLDSWIGADGVKYSSKQKGDIDNYPEAEARWLMENQFVEMI